MGDLLTTARKYLAALDAYTAARERPIEDVMGWSRAVMAAGDGVRVTMDALRAAVSADTGWRDRPPTVEEVRAHHEAHGGYWMGQVIQSATTPFVVWIAETKGLGGLGVYCDRCPWNDPSDVEWKNAFTADWYGGCMWRPLDHAGDPAPWPEVTP